MQHICTKRTHNFQYNSTTSIKSYLFIFLFSYYGHYHRIASLTHPSFTFNFSLYGLPPSTLMTSIPWTFQQLCARSFVHGCVRCVSVRVCVCVHLQATEKSFRFRWRHRCWRCCLLPTAAAIAAVPPVYGRALESPHRDDIDCHIMWTYVTLVMLHNGTDPMLP